MSLEDKSKELKEIVSSYDTAWFLGDLSGLMKVIANGGGQDQLGKLSSPLRQLYFLAGLMLTSEDVGVQKHHEKEKWDKIVDLLNEIEACYDSLFFPESEEEVDEQWKLARKVAMPSFLGYFNQGPLNYQEQGLNWVTDLYTQLDDIIEAKYGVRTEVFIQFYNNLDDLVNSNFTGIGPNGTKRDNWKDYVRVQVGLSDGIPPMMMDRMREMFEEREYMMTFMADHGMINRFRPEDLVSDKLSLNQVNAILGILTCKRSDQDFLYYTATKPGNPLYSYPIVDIGEGLYQVFEVKQVMHSIEGILEQACSETEEYTSKLVDKKGKLLESRVEGLFAKLTDNSAEIITSYYVDDCEQDILVLWEDSAFIIEPKGYKLREPFRDPDKAFIRIKDDFKDCIGYGFDQTKRVAQKFLDQVPLEIKDKHGNIQQVIDTTKYQFNDYSIIVNLESFGQIQNDLSTLLDKGDLDYPWAVKLDDLEVIILTILAHKKDATILCAYLEMRKSLHGRLICSDELELFGAFITGEITDEHLRSEDYLVTTPDIAAVFDEQYRKGMGFDNERMLDKKTSGKWMFWG